MNLPFEKARDINYIWFDCTVNIECPCGNSVQLIDEACLCDCGRIYRLRAFVEVFIPDGEMPKRNENTEYKLKRDMVCEQYGRAFFLPKGSICHYFAHTNVYLFASQDNYVPYFSAETVENFPIFFKLLKPKRQPAPAKEVKV
jgi:hypothetical protein